MVRLSDDAQASKSECHNPLVALDKLIMQGIADADAGLLHDLEEVCEELNEKYTRMAGTGS